MNGADQALQVKMFRYVDPATGIAQSPSQICDNSPTFIADPTAAIIQNPFDTIFFQNFALDRDITDAILFGVDNPVSNNLVPYAYLPPYSLANPLPALIGPPSISAANTPINPATGEVVFRATTTGNFVSVVRVNSIRNGQIISSAYRDFAVKVIPNPVGAPTPYNPNLTAPSLLFAQRAPVISPPQRMNLASGRWEINVYANDDTLIIPIQITDTLPKYSGNPANAPSTWQAVPSSFVVAVNGSQLSTSNNINAGCALPPCATIRTYQDVNPPLPPSTQPTLILRGNGNPVGLGYNQSNSEGVKLVWSPFWPATAFQAGAPQPANVRFNFEITAIDKNCPLEGESKRPLTINVHRFPTSGINLRFDSVINTTGRNLLFFNASIDTVNLDPIDVSNFNGSLSSLDSAALLTKAIMRRERAFGNFKVHKSLHRQGPYQQAFSTSQSNLSSWLDTSSVPGQYYFLEITDSLNSFAIRISDTLYICALPPVSVSSAQGNQICIGGSLVLSASLPGPSRAYRWFRNNVLIGQSAVPDYTITAPGDYHVQVYDSTLMCHTESTPFNITSLPVPFEGEQICSVSFDTITGRNMIVWEKTPNVRTTKFIISREGSVVFQFDSIGEVPFGAPGIFIDSTANPNVQSWRYRLQVADSCGTKSSFSQSHQTIHLLANTGLNNEVNLSWSPYDGIPYTTHKILRSHAGSQFVEIGRVSANNFSFTDLTPPPGPKAYAIEIDVPGGCDPFARLQSITSIRSNLADVGVGAGQINHEHFDLQIYPNPSRGIFMLKLEQPLRHALDIALHHADGSLVRKVHLDAGTNSFELNLESEAAGVYYLSASDIAFSKRLVLIK